MPGEGDVGVDLGGGDGAVAQEGLDIADVHTRLQEGCGKGVSKHMRGDVAGRADALKVLMDDAAHGLRR